MMSNERSSFYLRLILVMQKWFTIVEVMVGILIFAFWLVGAYVLVQTALKVSLYSKQDIIATNLIREQLELIKNVRDTNWLALRDWRSLSWTLLPLETCGTDCRLESGAWYRVENRFDLSVPIKIEKIPSLGSTQSDRKSHIAEFSNTPWSVLRRCLDEKKRYISCALWWQPTPYYTFLQVNDVRTIDSQWAPLLITGALEITAYLATFEWGNYREYSFSTLISDWKK